MEDRQSSRKTGRGQAQSSRKEQTSGNRSRRPGRQREAIRVLGRVIRYIAANYKLAVTAVLACIIVSARGYPEGDGCSHTIPGG